MIKVFLVEDELIMRRGIKNKIPWEQEGFEFVGEASDGELAYPLILKEKPDILITDIKMPFMDGLELASFVKKELPNTKIIILSGYDEFDYAKKAIGIGVTDYLLKPISSEKLLAAIKKVGEIIRVEKEREQLILEYRKENEENIEKEKAKLFYSLVDQTVSVREILEKSKILGMDLIAPYYTVILLRLLSTEETVVYQENRVSAEQKFDKYLDLIDQIYYFKRWGEGWFIFLKSEEPDIFSILEEMNNFLKNIVKAEYNLSYFGGAGATVQRLGDVRNSFKEANRVCASRFFMDTDQILTIHDLNKLDLSNHTKDDFGKVDVRSIDRECLLSFLKTGDVEEADSFLNAYLENIGIESYESLIFRQYIIVDMYCLVSKFLEEIGSSAGDLSDKFKSVDEIKAKVLSKNGVRRYMNQLFAEALMIRDKCSRDKYSDLIYEAKNYVEQNYCNNEMSLNLVASHIGLSPSYFSTVFRQETGKTFIEYLTELRMNKAKELLKCTNKKTAEIAYDIGYKDSHYFSYIFKKTQKITPKDYRNM